MNGYNENRLAEPSAGCARPATVSDVRTAKGAEGMTVAVLADEPVIAHGLGELLRRTGLFGVTGKSTDVQEILDIVADGQARVVVLSSSAGTEEYTGYVLERVQQAARTTQGPVGTVCIVPTGSPVTTRTAGFSAATVLTTEDGAEGLTRAVWAARMSRRPAARTSRPAAPRPDLRRAGQLSLTPRELEVLQGMADGLSTRQIAERLDLSVHTVRTHVQRVLPKLGAHTRLRAIAVAHEENLVEKRSTSRLSSLFAAPAAAGRSGATAD